MEAQKSTYVADWLARRAALSPARVGLIDTAGGRERAVTFARWNAAANRTANFLASLGVRRGDRVSVHAENRVEYLDLLFACGKLGAILHNLNWRLSSFEIGQMIADAAPRVLVYSPRWAARVAEMRPALAEVEHIVAMDGGGAGAALDPVHRLLGERDGFPDRLDPDASRPLSLDDPWAIYPTGGTTGLPKGSVVTHGNAAWNSASTLTSFGLHAGHTAILQLPLFHVGGSSIFTLPLVHVGGTTILCREFDVDQTLDLIDRGAVTHYIGVPTMYVMLQQSPRWAATDFSRLELVISGGAPCPRPVMEAFWDRGIDFKVGYGLTEAAVNNFWLPPEDVRRKPGSVGVPVFHTDMKIIRPDGAPCDPDEVGELCIRGPHVTPGYWNRPEATAAAIRDGWLHTGDLASVDPEGYYTILGRSKEMYISGGENVYPAEVESAIHAHPAVAEAAVVGAPDETWGEVGHAFVSLEPGQQLGPDDLMSFLASRLARYKLPRTITVLPELPRTAVGKIDKKRLLPAD